MIDWAVAPRVAELAAVSAEEFHAAIKPKELPVIFRGLTAVWPAVSAAVRSDEALLDYLAAISTPAPAPYFEAAPETGGRIGYNADFTGFNFERRTGNVRDLIDALRDLKDTATPPSLYAGALRMAENFPTFHRDNPLPLIASETNQLNSMWIGNRVRIGAHWDLARNLICVIGGRRRYILLPPDQLKNLYVGPVEFTPAGQPMSLVDFHNPDFSAHPRFAMAAERAIVADLDPGDALYLPSLWWHHAETLSAVGAMANVWWRDTPAHMTNPLTTIMHALLTIRDLPEAERVAWRAFFDHYVFQIEGDPMAHLPEAARGLFGAMTGEKARTLRAMLVQKLNF